MTYVRLHKERAYLARRYRQLAAQERFIDGYIDKASVALEKTANVLQTVQALLDSTPIELDSHKDEIAVL